MNTGLASDQIPADDRPMKKKMGRPPENGIGRVHLYGNSGPYVSLGTKLVLDQWKESYGVGIGRSIDAIVTHVKDDPSFRLRLPKHKLGG